MIVGIGQDICDIRRIEKTLEKLDVKHKRPRYVGRPASASTAAGTMALHNKELAAFLDAAFEK